MSSSQLFSRNYLVRVTNPDDETGNTSLEIRPPFNISFSCLRSKTKPKSLNIVLFGLSKTTRALLRKRIYESSQTPIIENGVLKSKPQDGLKPQYVEGGQRLTIELYICYGSNENLRRIFKGEIRTAINKLSESGYETEIEALSNVSVREKAFTARTITNRRKAIETLMKDAGLEVGKIDLINDDYIRPKVISGKPLETLKKMADNIKEEFYEDDGKGYFLPVRQSVDAPTVLVNASTGLLDTPTRRAEQVTFKCLINPKIVLGGKVELKSFVDPTVDGTYNVLDMTYVGDYEGSSWVVSVRGWIVYETD